jgi:hypothetical protein
VLIDRRMAVLPWMLLECTETAGTPHDLAGQGANPLPGQAGHNYMACSFQHPCAGNKRERDQFKTLRTWVRDAAADVGREESVRQTGMRQS